MLTTITFVVSAVCVIHWTVLVIGLILNNSMNLPAPLIHFFKQGYENTYVSSFAMAYQVYFWATYAGVLV